ncbi:hypothetical protein J3R30DRAFT_3714131 [Lentinula aciculospora]|uniref:Uncharacterized protein n=1 Tax=Lentinula aciculospora TaxID=153920 RepID=A0A9W8ZXC2_9AGAR|nr:hypothetical protein J3R30DRAFT_3714131 [Lentinula aciculospora]
MERLFSSSPAQHLPSTPLSNRTKSYSLSRSNHRPLNSSPLAHDFSSPFSSPVAEAQARRQSQYKSRVPSEPQRSRNSFAHNSRVPSRTAGSSSVGMDSQKAMLRDRFKQRCLKRAEKARLKACASKRRSYPSSDGPDESMDDDMDESDEDVMQGELYQRIMINQAHKERHAYLRSYYAEVGSSFDPDIEDVAVWENELHEPEPTSPVTHRAFQNMQERVETSPEELEQAELEAYAEECERQATLADFEDIPFDELFNDEELKELMADNNDNGVGQNRDVDMDNDIFRL